MEVKMERLLLVHLVHLLLAHQRSRAATVPRVGRPRRVLVVHLDFVLPLWSLACVSISRLLVLAVEGLLLGLPLLFGLAHAGIVS